MQQFFTAEYTGAPFQFMGVAHIVSLLLIVLLNIFWLRFRGASDSAKKQVRWIMAAVLILNEIGYHVWNLYFGRWNIQEHIPFCTSALYWFGSQRRC